MADRWQMLIEQALHRIEACAIKQGKRIKELEAEAKRLREELEDVAQTLDAVAGEEPHTPTTELGQQVRELEAPEAPGRGPLGPWLHI